MKLEGKFEQFLQHEYSAPVFDLKIKKGNPYRVGYTSTYFKKNWIKYAEEIQPVITKNNHKAAYDKSALDEKGATCKRTADRVVAGRGYFVIWSFAKAV